MREMFRDPDCTEHKHIVYSLYLPWDPETQRHIFHGDSWCCMPGMEIELPAFSPQHDIFEFAKCPYCQHHNYWAPHLRLHMLLWYALIFSRRFMKIKLSNSPSCHHRFLVEVWYARRPRRIFAMWIYGGSPAYLRWFKSVRASGIVGAQRDEIDWIQGDQTKRKKRVQLRLNAEKRGQDRKVFSKI